MGVTPVMLQELTLDQIFVMAWDKGVLKTGRRIVKGSVAELAAKGVIPKLPKESFVQRMEREAREAKKKK